jgi:hypothetical protein
LLWRRWRGAQSGRSALMPGKETAARLEGEPSEGKPRRCYSSRAICIKLGSLHHGMAGEPPLLAPLVLRRTQRRQCANRAIAFSARDYGFRVVSTIERVSSRVRYRLTCDSARRTRRLPPRARDRRARRCYTIAESDFRYRQAMSHYLALQEFTRSRC